MVEQRDYNILWDVLFKNLLSLDDGNENTVMSQREFLEFKKKWARNHNIMKSKKSRITLTLTKEIHGNVHKIHL